MQNGEKKKKLRQDRTPVSYFTQGAKKEHNKTFELKTNKNFVTSVIDRFE